MKSNFTFSHVLTDRRMGRNFYVGVEGFEPPKPKGNEFTVRPNSPSLAHSH